MRKGKEAITAAPSRFRNPNHGSEDDDRINTRPFSSVPSSPRNASSKYDFVKVKVWLGDNADHYYVLSRFLLSRMLTVTKIPNHVAIKIALELKKLLIDNSLLDVSQSDLEANLFKLMERRGYGEEYISRYKMMTRFHHQRVPLVILVCGTACVGKSTIATQLAQRLNLPNVLQTDMVYELLRTATDAPLTSVPVWARNFSSSEELITEFCRECRIVRKGLGGDLKKAKKDGKPIIIEGIHLDPSIYLMEDENKVSANTPEKDKETHDENPEVQKENVSICGNHNEAVNTSGIHLENVTGSLESVNLSGNAAEHKGEAPNTEKERKPLADKGKSGPEPIVLSIVLKMSEYDHKSMLEEWISTRTFSDKSLAQEKDRLINNLKTIQDYLCSFNSQGVTVVNISATTFPQTLDWLHNYFLQAITLVFFIFYSFIFLIEDKTCHETLVCLLFPSSSGLNKAYHQNLKMKTRRMLEEASIWQCRVNLRILKLESLNHVSGSYGSGNPYQANALLVKASIWHCSVNLRIII